jgi:glucose-6-phosphate isomerase
VLEDRIGASIEIEPGATSGDFLSGFLQGTRQALYENQRDSITVTISEVNPRTVGALIERAAGLHASLVNIKVYNQPGVEAGKKTAETLLELQRKILDVLKGSAQPLELTSLAEKAGAIDQIEHVYKIVRHLAAIHRDLALDTDYARPGEPAVSYNRA